MAKYTFTCQHLSLYNKPIDKITYEIETETLTSVLEGLENFLKGCGFVYKGTLDIVPPDEPNYEDTITRYQNEDSI